MSRNVRNQSFNEHEQPSLGGAELWNSAKPALTGASLTVAGQAAYR